MVVVQLSLIRIIPTTTLTSPLCRRSSRRTIRSASSSSSTTTTTATTTSTTADGTRMFFNWLEQKYGARYGGKPLPMMNRNRNDDHTSTNNNTDDTETNVDDIADVVMTRSSLELEDLTKLFRHEIAALKITNFYPPHSAIQIGRELEGTGTGISSSRRSSTNSRSRTSTSTSSTSSIKMKNWKVSTAKGLESSDVFTLGRHPPYNIAVAQNKGDNTIEEAYFNQVRKELRHRRGLPLHHKNDDDNDDDENKTHNNNNSNINNNNNAEEEVEQSCPRLWPLDLLRLELDEIWPHGAGLARRSDSNTTTNTKTNTHTQTNTCMSGGLPRLMIGPTRWKKGLVHVDELAPLSMEHGCFSMNIYLQLPYSNTDSDDTENATNSDSSIDSESSDTDGTTNNNSDNTDQEPQPVMELWPLQIKSKWDWYRNAPTLSHLSSQDPEGQVILRHVLKETNKQTISVCPGDLILLCVQRPHCAMGFGHNNNEHTTHNSTPTSTPTGDTTTTTTTVTNNHNTTTTPTPMTKKKKKKMQTRVSLQCFLQYNGTKERLTIDS